MGNHRPLPYSGLHFSKNDPRNGALSAVITVVVSLIVAVAFLAACAMLVGQLDIPVRFTADGASAFVMVKTFLGGIFS
jgi:hypothetical protein